jgi:hypothetical protein
MSNPQDDVRDALRSLLVEKGDYTTLVTLLRDEDDRRFKESLVTLLTALVEERQQCGWLCKLKKTLF